MQSDTQQQGGKSLLFVVPQAKFFLSHRVKLATIARERGYRVAVACPASPACARFEELGLEFFALPFHRNSRNPLRDIPTLLRIDRIVREFRPSAMHLITAKATLYGGIIARIRSVPTIAAITGLGFLFAERSASHRLARTVLLAAYRLILNRADCSVIFQNAHDQDIFERAAILARPTVVQLPGAGVDLTEITAQPLPNGIPIVVMPCRILRMKGVEDFHDAARICTERGIKAVFRLVGDPDPDNPTSIAPDVLRGWEAQGAFEWWTHRSDMNEVLAAAHLVALPSHGGEGLPKTLIDAAAAGRAAVTTDVPGCRDAVVDGVTGLICPARNPEALADAFSCLLADRAKLERMGYEARKRSEAQFDIVRVIAVHQNIYDTSTGHQAQDGSKIAEARNPA